MPTYCYTTQEGHTVEYYYPIGQAPKTVTLDDGSKAHRDIVAEHAAPKVKFRGGGNVWRGMTSESAAVAPDQIPEVQAELKAHGVSCNYTPDGRPEFISRSHRKAFCKALGYSDFGGGYGDAI